MEYDLLEIKPDNCIKGEFTFDVFTEKNDLLSSDIPAHPLLVSKKAENFQLIYGLAEYNKRKKENKKIVAYLLPENINFHEMFCTVTNYHKQYYKLNHFEISNLLLLLHQRKNYSLPYIADNFAKILHIAPQKNMIKNYLSLQKINRKIIEFLIRKDAPLKKWLIFTDIEEKEQKYLEKIVERMQPSLSTFTQIAKNLLEISIRDDVNIINKINQLGLEKSIEAQNTTTALKQLKEKVRKARYPVLEKRKEEIEDRILNLKLPNNIKIIPDKTLETKHYKIQIEIKNKEDIENSISYLKNRLAEIKEFFENL